LVESEGISANGHRLAGAEPGNAEGGAGERIVDNPRGRARHRNLAGFAAQENLALRGVLMLSGSITAWLPRTAANFKFVPPASRVITIRWSFAKENAMFNKCQRLDAHPILACTSGWRKCNREFAR
jgi:hypothetical protein